jgi:hypothetical protein
MVQQRSQTTASRESMRRKDSTSGVEQAVGPDNAIQAYQAVNDDHSIHDEIARTAYEFYLRRAASGGAGSAEEDWFRAEHEVMKRRGDTLRGATV